MTLDSINSLSTCVIKTLHHIPRLYATSGHFAFQYGAYDTCIQSADYRYHMIEFDVFHATKGITMGICLPKQCSNKLVTNVLTQAFKLSGQPIYIYRVVTDPQNYQFEYSWVFYLTVLILGLFGLLVAIASLRKNRQGWLKGFAIQDNLEKLMTKRQTNLKMFDGVRAITLMWVIMGNTFINSLIGAVNIITVDFVFQRPFVLIVQCALLTVDIFFFVGGFFIAYKFAKDLTGSILNFPLLILKRIFRYLPAYVLIILVWYSMFMHLGNGPKWIPDEQYTSLCKNMWRTVLFVDNLVNNGHTLCMSWAFYMQIEFQVFLASVVLLFVYSKTKLGSLVVTAGLIIYSWTINLVYTEQHKQEYPISMKALYNYQNYIFDVFLKPYYRWTPYFFGLFVGLVYAQFASVKDESSQPIDSFRKASIAGKVIILKNILKQKVNLRRFIEWFGIAIMSFVTFFPRMLQEGYVWSQAFHSMCLNFGRILYPFAIFLVILPSMLGVQGSFFRTLLSSSFFTFFARISYGVYLVHGLIILYISGTKRYDTYFTILDLYVNSLAIIVLSMFFGFIVTLFLELPSSYLMKKVLPEKLEQKMEIAEERQMLLKDKETIESSESQVVKINRSFAGQETASSNEKP